MLTRILRLFADGAGVSGQKCTVLACPNRSWRSLLDGLINDPNALILISAVRVECEGAIDSVRNLIHLVVEALAEARRATPSGARLLISVQGGRHGHVRVVSCDWVPASTPIIFHDAVLLVLHLILIDNFDHRILAAGLKSDAVWSLGGQGIHQVRLDRTCGRALIRVVQ